MRNGGFFIKWWIALGAIAVVLMLHDTIVFGGELGPTGKWAILVGLAAATMWLRETICCAERRLRQSVNRRRQEESEQQHMYSVR